MQYAYVALQQVLLNPFSYTKWTRHILLAANNNSSSSNFATTSSSSSSNGHSPRIEGLPSSSLTDERLRLRVTGLASRSRVSLRLGVTNGVNLDFCSSNSFRADEEGEVDLERDAPLTPLKEGGRTYKKIVDSMGIFRQFPLLLFVLKVFLSSFAL